MFNCPNCSPEFRSADAVISHLSVEGSCGHWLVCYLPNLHDTENVHYNEDPDAAHDSKLFFYFFNLSIESESFKLVVIGDKISQMLSMILSGTTRTARMKTLLHSMHSTMI
jgi:hypothetical protein